MLKTAIFLYLNILGGRVFFVVVFCGHNGVTLELESPEIHNFSPCGIFDKIHMRKNVFSVK